MEGTDKNIDNNSYTLKVSLFCISLMVFCYIFLRITWAVFMRPFWETACIAVFLFFFLHIKSIKSYILSLPKSFIKVYFIFFYIFCLCHCLSIPRTTFPFVPWNMFSDETRFSNVVKFYKYEAMTREGQKISLRPELYFRSLANGRIVTDLDNLVTAITLYNPQKEKDLFKRQQQLVDDYAKKQGGLKGIMPWFRLNIYEENLFTLAEKKQHLNEILQAIALRYDAWHPHDPLTSIDIIRGTIDISKGARAIPSFSNVWHLGLEGRSIE